MQSLNRVKRGRPRFSQIRENIKDMLREQGSMYGYEIYKQYIKKYGSVSRRSIYYQLQEAINEGAVAIDKIEQEKGEYSWGSSAQKIYYKLVA